MPCVVPTCGATVGTFKPFPRHKTLSERWFEAIHVGCGTNVEHDSHLRQVEICEWHFENPNDEKPYLEPKIFITRKGGQLEIDSCRLCLRFYPSCDMVSKNGKLGGIDIKFNVYESLRINFHTNDLLDLVCTECLARLELLKSIQKDFLDAEIKFQCLIKIARDSVKDTYGLKELPPQPPIKVFVQKDPAESTSELDGGIVEEESSDAWTLPKAPLDILQKPTDTPKQETKSTSWYDSEQPELSLTDMLMRKCYICPVILDNANELSSHLTVKHAKKGVHHCEECSLDFPLLAKYNRHLSRHDQTERPNKCRFCPLRFKLSNTKLVHENKHHGTHHKVIPYMEKPQPVVCETCGQSFSYMSSLNSHIRHTHIADENKPKCNICSKSFTTQTSLDRHMLLHTNEKPYCCSKCDASYRRQLDLRHHVQKEHEGINPHVCAECNKEFRNYLALYHHKRIVHLNKPPRRLKPPRQCRLCWKRYSKISELEQHVLTSHANESYPYLKCPLCPNSLFLSKLQECMHKMTVHSQRQYDCPICITKTYKSQAALSVHMNLHTKGKQFSCDFCGKTFHRNSQLAIHQRLHTGEKPFECPSCLKRFSDDGTFSKHKKRCLATISKGEEDDVVNEML